MQTISLWILPLIGLLSIAEVHGEKNEDWELVQKDKVLTVWRGVVPGSSIYAVKAEAIFDFPLIRVASVFRDLKRRHEWAKYFGSGKVLKKLGPLDSIQYVLTSPPWPVDDRDVVFETRSSYDKEKNEFILEAKSIETELAPEIKGIVRGHISYSRLFLTSLEDGRTHARTEIHADPKGWIPNWSVNIFMQTWPNRTYQAWNKQLKKPDIKIDPAIRDLIEGK